MAYTIPWNLLAMQISGDVGGYTIFTDRFGRKTVFPKSPPEKPPSSQQLIQRQRFKTAQTSWNALSSDQVKNLEDACRITNVPMTGQNLWIHTALTNDTEAMKTIERQSGITLTIPSYVP